MNYSMLLKSGVLIVCFLSNVWGHVYRTGSDCPVPKPMVDFNMEKFLGVWYAIQKSRTASSCLVYNITASNTPNEYNLEQTSRRVKLNNEDGGFEGLDNPPDEVDFQYTFTYVGRIISQNRQSSQMNVQYPLNMMGDASFDVFDTDYDNYAGIFTCQPILFVRRQSVTLLSRTRHLAPEIITQLRYKLYDNDIHAIELDDIEQDQCTNDVREDNNNNYHQGPHIGIDQNQFKIQVRPEIITAMNLFSEINRIVSDAAQTLISPPPYKQNTGTVKKEHPTVNQDEIILSSTSQRPVEIEENHDVNNDVEIIPSITVKSITDEDNEKFNEIK